MPSNITLFCRLTSLAFQGPIQHLPNPGGIYGEDECSFRPSMIEQTAIDWAPSNEKSCEPWEAHSLKYAAYVTRDIEEASRLSQSLHAFRELAHFWTAC